MQRPDTTGLQTPSQTVGPFFHDALIWREASLLTQDHTSGERILVTGQILDGDGVPVDDAMLEIWQPDANGIFAHPADPRHADADPHFTGFGRVESAPTGSFAFETVRPGIPPGSQEGQAPFIYVTLFSRGLLVHAVTRMYFSDDPTSGDPVLTRVDPTRRQTLIAQRQDSAGVPTYRFDVRLQGDRETVFFDL